MEERHDPAARAPGDEQRPDTPQTAANVCRACRGTGRLRNGGACPACLGSGEVVETVGDA